jgi:hypothetical protein
MTTAQRAHEQPVAEIFAAQNCSRGLAYANTSSRNAAIAAQLRASAFGR